MNAQLAAFILLGAAWIAGDRIGCVIPRFARMGRALAFGFGLFGGGLFLVGSVGADTDARFRAVALVGFSFQVAGLVSAREIRKAMRRNAGRTVDLWAIRKRRHHPSHS